MVIFMLLLFDWKWAHIAYNDDNVKRISIVLPVMLHALDPFSCLITLRLSSEAFASSSLISIHFLFRPSIGINAKLVHTVTNSLPALKLTLICGQSGQSNLVGSNLVKTWSSGLAALESKIVVWMNLAFCWSVSEWTKSDKKHLV